MPSLRSVALGCIMCAIIGVSGPYWTIYLQSSRLYADYHTAGATFFLFVLFLLFNVVLGLFWKQLALRTDELMVTGAMMLVGGSIVTSGLVAYFIPSISSVYNLANATNNWRGELWPVMPRMLAPLDPDGGILAITRYWMGLRAGQPIPWQPWVRPLAVWGVFLMSMFACMMAIMTIMRKQWVDYEHLSFPIAQVPAELCVAAGSPWHRASIFRSKAFWIALGLTFLLASFGGVSYYLGRPTFFRSRHWVELAEEPWRYPLYFDVVVVGLVFLIPNRIAFTVWFVAFLSWLAKAFMTSYNLAFQDEWVMGGAMDHLAAGAMIVFVVSSLWLSRDHLRRALRCAFGRGETDYDSGEPSSYRTAFILILLTCLVMVGWFSRVGLGPFYGLVLVLLTLAIYYTMARVVAQCGLPMLSPPVYPHQFMASTFGSGSFSSSQVTVLGSHMGWHFDMRNSVMSGSGHGMYLSRRRRSGLFWAMLLGLVISYVAACVCAVWIGYAHGATNMDPWFYGNFPRLPWEWSKAAITHHGGPSGVRLVWGGVGALIMAALVVAQRTYFWWPLHPVGLLICSSHMVYFFSFSVFLAWLVKVLLVTFGGPAMFRPARRFCIGMVMGNFLAGGVWAIIDTCTGSVGDAVFYI
ncbi:MAG: hypothetical protein AMK73_08415 [Planctomycetes bacterium SM23_32]|nr:MAG: hypothetical protein AMK73_08415 [Planctomycetes bacterium SM23_32]